MYLLSRLVLIAAAAVLACAALGLWALLHPLTTVLVALYVLSRMVRKGGHYFFAHGTARWADVNDLRRARMLEE